MSARPTWHHGDTLTGAAPLFHSLDHSQGNQHAVVQHQPESPRA
jgi:hypothetical protein